LFTFSLDYPFHGVIVKRFNGLSGFFQMKTTRSGRAATAQKKWLLHTTSQTSLKPEKGSTKGNSHKAWQRAS